jgi:hypothetical protein
MSSAPFVSPVTRFVAMLSNATYRPSLETELYQLVPFAWASAELTFTRWVSCAEAGAERTRARIDAERNVAMRCMGGLFWIDAGAGPCYRDSPFAGPAAPR